MPEPNANQKAEDVAALGAVLPLIEEIGLADFRDRDWCQSIDYAGGHFASKPEDDHCADFEGDAVALAGQARTDFDLLREALDDTGVRIAEVTVYGPNEVSPRGGISFDVVGGDFDRWSYVYEPDYLEPEDLEGEWEATPIDPDWYFVWEDWN